MLITASRLIVQLRHIACLTWLERFKSYLPGRTVLCGITGLSFGTSSLSFIHLHLRQDDQAVP